MRTWPGICLTAAGFLLFGAACRAQTSVTPEDEYKQLIKVNQDVQPLGAHPFGENISLYDGTLTFSETDVSLPGNGPKIELSRSLAPEEFAGYGVLSIHPFYDWDLDIPRIETITAIPAGWQTSTAGSPTGGTNRCSNFTPPPYAPSTVGGGAGMWAPSLFWYGYHLIMPGQGNQELMPRASANTLTPTISGKSFSIVTKNNWMVGCGVTASDGGEGFLAIAPDGTRYTFAHLIYRPAATLSAPAGPIPPPPATAGIAASAPQPMVAGANILERNDALMYVTKIQDRFGNTVTYNYDPTSGYLSSITANDGREVDITYVSGGSPLIHSVTAKATDVPSRTWTYVYAPSLTGVQLPDGSAWSFSGFGGVFSGAPIIPTGGGGDCYTKQLPTVPALTPTGTITHPSGLTATFSLKATLRGRSYVPWTCYGSGYVSAAFPEYSVQYSMVSEVLSGAGMPTQTWQYNYSPANLSWTSDACASGNTCPSTVYTDVIDPNGDDTRTTFSNRYDVTEGQLQRTDYYSGAAGGTLLRSEIDTYANPTGGPWPAAYGNDWVFRDNQAQVTELSPLSQRIITQGSDAYTWQVQSGGFNAYAQPTDIKRYSNVANQSSIEETTSYLNDTNLWVLGLPLQVTNIGTGDIESANTYNPTNDTLLTRSAFGELRMTYTFNSAGQLTSFNDGNAAGVGHTTSLSNYKRGIPQLISYPDQHSESLVVDDLGQISSLTDQAGHTTSYSYDAVGRIKEIDYPTGDEQSWYPEKFSYDFVASAERGLSANHWRRSTSENGTTLSTTYFDATLRPVLSDSNIGSTVIASTLVNYDSKGQKTYSSYPSDSALSFTLTPTAKGAHTTYDALERVTQVQQDSELGTLTSSTAYLPGASQSVTDPNGKVTTTYYQVFDTPSYDVPIKVVAPTGITQQIARDTYGSPLSITQSGPDGAGGDVPPLTKSMTYDIYHRLCRTHEPESGDSVVAYDGANNISYSAAGLTIPGTASACGREVVLPASETVFNYDEMNRVKTIAPPAGTQPTSYTYDALGNVAWASSGSAIWENHYNFRGMMTSETLHMVGTDDRLVTYHHDAYGNQSSVVYPGLTLGSAGESVAYAPDALGRPTQAVSPTATYASGVQYYPNGQVKQFAYGSGALYVAAQNDRQLTNNFKYVAGASTLLSENLIYDPNSNITNVNDAVNGGRTKTFHYDDLNRLKDATSPLWGGTESYTYDALNNLRTRNVPSQSMNYVYDASNLLRSITRSGGPTSTFDYDTQGNQILRNGATLQFDKKNQLLGVVGYDTYQYDANGRRVEKTPNGGTFANSTFTFYNHAGQLLYQYEPALSKATNFIYLGTRMVGDDENTVLGAPGAVVFDNNPNTGNYSLTWGAVPSATSYNLQESTDGGTTWGTSLALSGTNYAYTGKAPGGYVYHVQGCIGTICSGWTLSATLGVVPMPPATVTVPTTTIGGPNGGAFILTWAASAGASAGYSVQTSANGGPWTSLQTYSDPTMTSLQIVQIPVGTNLYRVAALDAYGSIGWTTSTPVTVGAVPADPTGFTVPSTGTVGNVVLTWNAVAGATSYKVGATQINSPFYGEYIYYPDTDTSFNLPLTVGHYDFLLKACNSVGCSLGTSAGPLWLKDPTATDIKVHAAIKSAAHIVGMDIDSGGGCSATSCAATVGDQP